MVPTATYLSSDQVTGICTYEIQWPTFRFSDLELPGYWVTLINSTTGVEVSDQRAKRYSTHLQVNFDDVCQSLEHLQSFKSA
jgi:hypothetical protein